MCPQFNIYLFQITKTKISAVYLALIFIFLPFSYLFCQAISKKIDPKTGFLKIQNEWGGIIIPWKDAISKSKYDLAPIQSFIYIDGTNSDTTINYLNSDVKPVLLSTTILKDIPSEYSVKLSYQFNKPAFIFHGQSYPGGGAGKGYYHLILTCKSGSKSIILEEESNYDVYYSVGINNGLNANKARYRGYNADSKENGYEPDGKVYRSDHDRGYGMDATVDLDFKKGKLFNWIPVWDAGGRVNTGRYWQLYNDVFSDKAPVIGYFMGKPSKIKGGEFMAPRINISQNLQGQNQIELINSIGRRGPDNSWFPLKRVQWVVFLSVKADILSPEKNQPIALELNFIAGLASKIKNYSLENHKLSAYFYDGAIYLSKSEIKDLITRVKTNESFYRQLLDLDDGLGLPIWESWRFPEKAKQHIGELIAFRDSIIKEYTWGEGTFSEGLRYWKGVRTFRGNALLISGLFADKSIKISYQEKEALESLVAIMARILWDEDNVPLNSEAGVNLGNANMVHQYLTGGRYFFALLFSKDPFFVSFIQTIRTEMKKEVESLLYPNGSSFGSPHYIQAAIDPLLFLLLQMRQAGHEDLFAMERMKEFTRFYLSLLTPPSVRFSGNRKLISMGDGTEENACTFGLLASGYSRSDTSLSKILKYVFFKGSPRGSFAGPAPLALDFSTITDRSLIPVFSSCYDGYISHARIAANSNKESALWAINGDKYFDHRNDDAGECMIYALGAPLSVSRSSFYYPRADAAHVRDMVIPLQKFPEWNGPNQPINGRPTTWAKTELLEYASFPQLTYFNIKSEIDSIQWFRSIAVITLPDSTPVIYITDSIAGSVQNIWSMNMMSEGAIKINQGLLQPVLKMHHYTLSNELPDASTTKDLPSYWNTFSFTGQEWPLHRSGGIDWDVYMFSSQEIKANASYWSTNYQNELEKKEFQLTNHRVYSEAQQILRILFGAKSLHTIIVPRLKSAMPYRIFHSNRDQDISFDHMQWSCRLLDHSFSIKQKESHIETFGVFGDTKSIKWSGLETRGGCIQLTKSGSGIEVYLSGNAGDRFLSLDRKIRKPEKGQILAGTNTFKISQAISTINTPNKPTSWRPIQLTWQ